MRSCSFIIAEPPPNFSRTVSKLATYKYIVGQDISVQLSPSPVSLASDVRHPSRQTAHEQHVSNTPKSTMIDHCFPN